MNAPDTGRNRSLDAAVAQLEERYVGANPKSGAQFDASLKTMPGANTRSVLFYDPFPVTLVGGKAAVVTDLDGHDYVDFLGEYTAGLYGHSDPTIAAAVRKALAAGTVLGGPNPYEAELATLMCERFPSVERVRFCNSGTEGNLMALSLARVATGRDTIMVFDGAYHGGVFYYAHGGSPMNVPFPTIVGEYNDADRARALITEHAADLAAIIVEPMMGSGGGIAGTPEFLGALRAEADRHGIVLVFDEVMTSRLAPGGLQERLGILPDLTSFGKYLGGGLTFGAFGGSAKLMGRFDPRSADALPHSGTYNNNMLTMAAGAAGLRDVFTPQAAAHLNESGDRLRQRLQEAARAAGVPAQISGVGSILAVHFQERPIVRPADTEDTPLAARKLFHLAMLHEGLYLARRGFISLSLPLQAADYDRFVTGFETFLNEHGDLLERGPTNA